MIAVIDYGVGNLFSLHSSLKAVGAEAEITADENKIKAADQLILPGVGAFGDAAAKLRENGLDQLIIEQAQSGKPLLGICLGMQLLFDKSYEFGEHRGLGLIPGEVVPMQGTLPESLKIPHIGWNRLQLKGESPLLAGIHSGDYVYFVHSYYAVRCASSVIAATDYGIEMTAAVGRDNIYGCQFHPEKSGSVGLRILKTFSEMEAGV